MQRRRGKENFDFKGCELKKVFTIFVFFLFFSSFSGDLNYWYKDYNWKDAAKYNKFSKREIKLLKKNKYFLSNESTYQCFELYLDGYMLPYLGYIEDKKEKKAILDEYKYKNFPILLTVDSVINTFNVLLSETFYSIELNNSANFQSLISKLNNSYFNFKNNKKSDINKSNADRKISIVFETILKILNDDYVIQNTDYVDLINEEVIKIKNYKIKSKPNWLGKSVNSLGFIDYSKCKPMGFYLKEEFLSKYFMAVSWVQQINFDLNDEIDSKILFILKDLISKTFGLYDKVFYQFYKNSCIYFNDKNQLTLNDLSELNYSELEKMKAEKKKGMIFKIVAKYETPDYLFFEKLLNESQSDSKIHASGIDIAALINSETLKKSKPLRKYVNNKSNSILKDNKFLENDGSYYSNYLKLLRNYLNSKNNNKFHEIYKNWEIKKVNTALSGFVQFKHIFQLQSKFSAVVAPITIVPPGIVEPAPQFYEELNTLLNKITYSYKSSHFDNYENKMDILNRWKNMKEIILKLQILSLKQLSDIEFSDIDFRFIKEYGEKLAYCMFYDGNSYYAPKDDAPKSIELYTMYYPKKTIVKNAAIGRPCLIYVLYPFNGKKIIFRGAVFPYYEYESEKRVNDKEWKELLDSKSRPDLPQWLKQIVGKEGKFNPKIIKIH